MFKLHGLVGEHYVEAVAAGGLDHRLGLRSLGNGGWNELAARLGLVGLTLLTRAAENVAARLLVACGSHDHQFLDQYGSNKTIVFLDVGHLAVDFHHASTAGGAKEPDCIAYLYHNIYIKKHRLSEPHFQYYLHLYPGRPQGPPPGVGNNPGSPSLRYGKQRAEI